ncbi:MAG: hypothetical protein WA151_10510, partial [Desulfatirhabdiaceae bacterium]
MDISYVELSRVYPVDGGEGCFGVPGRFRLPGYPAAGLSRLNEPTPLNSASSIFSLLKNEPDQLIWRNKRGSALNNVFLPEIETEAVLNEIKLNMNRFNEMGKGTHAVNPDQCDQRLQFKYLEDAVNSIDVAQKHSAVGSELPPMYSMKGVKRKIATFLGKLLLRAGLIFTRDQRIYNQSVLDSISHMCLGIKAQEQMIYNLSKQLSDFSTTGLEGIKRESELSLKENLHHEIKLLTGRLEKAYPKICQIDKSHLDNLYLAFEDRFRGRCQRVKEHVKNYIPFIAEAKAGTPEYPVLDVGCGRGEW